MISILNFIITLKNWAYLGYCGIGVSKTNLIRVHENGARYILMPLEGHNTK